ncbi:MAG: glutathione S-transferase [Sulfitobacter sp.]|nr:glutathione S-transferase [Sulfitobacter sp.]
MSAGDLPVLWSFRRCPYAIRARTALAVSGTRVALREVVLRDKPEAFLQASPSATVPCLVTAEGVIDESLDIMRWALARNDPDDWLEMPAEGEDWIARGDGPFKKALDRTKYASRYPGEDAEEWRAEAEGFLADLDGQLGEWLFDRPTLADFALLPFVRQFAFIDKARFDAGPWGRVQDWLGRYLASDLFAGVMAKYVAWQEGDQAVVFPQ